MQIEPTSSSAIAVILFKEILELEDLTLVDKLILCKVIMLDNEANCWASNNFFATLLKISPITVSKSINKMLKTGDLILKSFDGRRRKLTTPKRKLRGLFFNEKL